MEIRIRKFCEEDSVDELTDLLHRAYKRLADMGLRYVATDQSAEVTAQRISRGECYIAEKAGAMVGCITLNLPSSYTGNCEHYKKPGVAYFGQFAVEPAIQSSGIGSELIRFVERRALELGFTELALDTADSAKHLIAFYEKRGYRTVQFVQWDVTNYRSVVMSKNLNGS